METRILIVDDDSITRKFVSFLLRSESFQVLSARDGIEALEIIASEEIDLVITDLNMPRMDGIELIRHIRGSAQSESLPIILLTTESDDESRQLGLQAGASEYMSKPVSKERLACKVREWLQHRVL